MDLQVIPRPHEGTSTSIDPELLCERFRRHDALVGMVGLGYVGLPLSLAASDSGLRVIGFDVNEQRVLEINAGTSPLNHITNDRILKVRSQNRFEATSDPRRLRAADAILICVPTPLGVHHEPDLSFVVKTAEMLVDILRPGQLIVLESTTYPGTTREVVKPVLEKSGLRSGQGFFLAYSPEREDPGNLEYETSRIPKIVAGDGSAALQITVSLYRQFIAKIVPVSSLETAEAVKLTENIFRSVNIALVNELKVVFAALNIDIFEVVDAAKTKPFGYMPFYPGPGLGGHCIPIDPFYLTWRAREVGVRTRFIELAGEINANMPHYVVGRLREELDRRFRKALSGSRILVIGLSYKKNVSDMRESPALTVMELLDHSGAKVDYHDPFFPTIPATRNHPNLTGKACIPFEDYLLARFDAAVIVTDHDGIDYNQLVRFSRLVLDTRNVLAGRIDPEFFDVVARA
jgi:UDP-N-acetyl-D-glucosamine dehydrogenase